MSAITAARFVWRFTLIMLVCLPGNLATLVAADSTAPGGTRELAAQILKATGIQGGLVVHVGCGDGTLTAALRASGRYVVQGLDTSPENVRAARARLQAAGLYGPVAVDQFDGRHLPFVDNLVNLVVSEQTLQIERAEVLRVLAPGGAAYVRDEGGWRKTVKPQPDNTDEWTHYLHDASGNAVGHDAVVGPPCHLQWTAEPRYTRSHEHTPSINALVSSGGRIFYIADEAPVAAIKQPSRWFLVARDAYNGLPLWKHPCGAWFPHLINWGQTPSQLQRRLVAIDDRVYVTLGLHAPLSCLDAATGETIRTYEETAGAEEMIFQQGILLVATREVTPEREAELVRFAQLETQPNSPLDKRESAKPLVKQFRAGQNHHSGLFYRWFNEFPAIILIIVVFLAVLRPA